MPEIGEIRKGNEVGFKGDDRYIWLACIDCGKERWVAVSRKSPRCVKCGGRERGQRCKGNKSSRWRGGRFIQHGYAYVKLQPDDFFYPMANKAGYVAEHRLVIARALGRCLLSWEIPHHKMGFAKDDNRYPETLELITDKRFHIVDLSTKRLIVQLKKQVDEQGKRIILLEAENILLREERVYNVIPQ